AAGEALAAPGRGSAVRPADGGRRPRKTLLQTDSVQHLPRRALVALADDIPETQRERIEPERVGDDVHLRLDGEVRLRARWGPERSAVGLVRVHGESFEMKVRDPVGTGEDEGRDRRDPRPRPRECPGVEPDPARLGRDPTVAGHPGLQLDDGALARVGGCQLLLARRHDLDRPGALPGQKGGERLDADPELAPETAADS